jgi:hypothetical protein
MPDFPSTLTAEHLFDIDVDLEPAQAVGQTPAGGRSIILIKAGTVSGPKLIGTVLPGGGDWLMTRSDGVGELDVRLTMKADDGGLIYMTYRGILKAAPEIFGRVFSGQDVPLSEYYFRTTPRFETSAEPHAWLNSRICVGVGAFGPNKVAYRVFGVS